MNTRGRWMWLAVVGAMAAAPALSRAQYTAPAPAPGTQPASSDAKPERPGVTRAQERADQNSKMQLAIVALLAEAKELDDLKAPKTTAYFTRPHPLMKDWGPEMATDALNRMLDHFTGNDYRDTYIRWHLMWAVNQAPPAVRRKMGERLVQAIKKMPGPLDVKEQPEYHADPPDVAAKFWALVGPMHVVVGFPPFQQVIGPPASFPYMDAARRQKSEADWVVAQTLKWKNIPDPIAIAFNQRIRQVNWIVRQYRGELVYALVMTGDPDMAKLIMSEIDRQARMKTGIAFDLMAFMYLATFDGALNLYPQAVLDDMSATLQKTATASVAWMDYGGQKRNFGDYAFHMVYMLRDGGGFTTASGGSAAAK